MTISNEDEVPADCRFWTVAVLPNGDFYPESGALAGPYDFSLAPTESVNGNLSHRIPLPAPTGEYGYIGFVSVYGDTAATESFDFTVVD
jgi:hypothetical protein